MCLSSKLRSKFVWIWQILTDISETFSLFWGVFSISFVSTLLTAQVYLIWIVLTAGTEFIVCCLQRIPLGNCPMHLWHPWAARFRIFRWADQPKVTIVTNVPKWTGQLFHTCSNCLSNLTVNVKASLWLCCELHKLMNWCVGLGAIIR